MPSDDPPHAPRPDRPPPPHMPPPVHPTHRDAFAYAGDHRPPRDTRQPEESRAGDRWTAVRGAVLVLGAAALVTWILATVLQ